MHLTKEDVYRDVLETLNVSDHWTRGVMARNKNDQSVDNLSLETLKETGVVDTLSIPVCWCLLGALDKTSDKFMRMFPEHHMEVIRLMNKAAKTLADKMASIQNNISQNDSVFGVRGVIVRWNDHPDRKHSEVIELLESML